MGPDQGPPRRFRAPIAFLCGKNLADALAQGFNAQGQALKAVTEARNQAPVAPPDGMMAVPVPPSPLPRIAQELAHHRQARRQALPQQLWAFPQQAWPGWRMAQPLGRGKTTVFRYLRTATVPKRQHRADRGRRILTPDHAYLLERWHTGYRDALPLFRERHPHGAAGSSPPVARCAPRLRQAQGQARKHRPPRQALPVVAEPSSRHLPARRATWLVLQRPERLDEDEAAQLARLPAPHPALAAAIGLAQHVAQRVRERQPDPLEPWLARLAVRPLMPLQRLARGRRDDDDAVKAGVTLAWSSGPVEGHLTRLNMLKRQRLGRAGRDLLQRRFLLAA